jgi:pimeloyl-ACP methyl ester carboxylesterase
MNPNPSLQLVLLPGLGADERLLAPQRTAFPDLLIPPWLPPHGSEGLPEYAARLAGTLPRDKPLIVGGVSLGGMIAYELARHVQSRAVVLIASCCTRKGIRPFFRIAGRLWPAVPPGIFHLLKCGAYPIFHCLSRTPAAQSQMLIAMFRSIDNRLMHWAVSAILRWRPKPLDQIPLHHIHGVRDRVIPARLLSPTVLIHNGGHLINLTHADEVNAFLRKVIQSQM